MVRRYAWFVVPLLFGAGCAATPANMQCDGKVFFVDTGCHLIASAASPGAATPQPQRSGAEPGPSSQPTPRSDVGTTTKTIAAAPTQAPPTQTAPPPPATPTPAEPTQQAQQPPAPPEPPVPPQLNVIYFAQGKAEITQDAKTALRPIADYLNNAKDESVELYAFSDPTGTKERNLDLLNQRATAVRGFLSTLGIPEARISIPKDFARIADNTYPKDEFWRLRKVMVKYSTRALEVADANEKREDSAAADDAKPAPAPAPKPVAQTTVKKGDKADAKAEETGPKLEKIDVMYWKSTNHALLLIAKVKGYFQDEGFDVHLHEAGLLEANQISVALAEGVGVDRQPQSAMELKKRKYFLGGVCPLGLHDALNKNIPLVQIGSLLENPNTLIVKKELAEALKKGLKGFEGKTIARQKDGPSTIDYTDLFVNQLKLNHISYKEKWYPTWAAMEEAVARGEVDAAISIPPYDEDFISGHPGLAIYELRNLYSRMPCCRQLVSRDQLRDKKSRDHYVRFERAIIRAHKFYRENKAETAELVAKILKMKPSIVRAVFSRPGYDLDPNPNLKGSIAFYNTLKDTIGKQDVRESVDTSIYKEALLSLAKEAPTDHYIQNAVREFNLTN